MIVLRAVRSRTPLFTVHCRYCANLAGLSKSKPSFICCTKCQREENKDKWRSFAVLSVFVCRCLYVSVSCLRHFVWPILPRVGLSRLCSATFEQLLAFGATFCGFSNLEQVLPFRAIFEQNIGLEHISSTKKSTISWKTSIHANFLKAYHVINLLNT